MSLFEVALIFGRIVNFMLCYCELQWIMPIYNESFQENTLLLNLNLCGVFWYIVPSWNVLSMLICDEVNFGRS